MPLPPLGPLWPSPSTSSPVPLSGPVVMVGCPSSGGEREGERMRTQGANSSASESVSLLLYFAVKRTKSMG